MTPLFGLLTAPSVHLLRRWVDAGMRAVDPAIVPDDLRDLHALLVQLDSSRQNVTGADTGSAWSSPDADDGPMTYKTAAQHLDCSPRTVARMVDDGRLPFVFVGARRRIPAGAVAMLKRGEHG